VGVHVVLIGTLIALLPNMKPAKVTVTQKERARKEAVRSGAVGVEGD
jgi:hypothetical protein